MNLLGTQRLEILDPPLPRLEATILVAGIKKDISEFVAKCKNYQKVKYEHQRPTDLL